MNTEAAQSMIKDVGARDFASAVIERSAEVPVVVDFWAPWCGPCRVLGPILEAEIKAKGGAVELVKVNTDQNQELAMQFGIQGIPAVKAFRGGKVVAEFVGVKPAEQIRQWLAALVPPPGAGALQKAEAAAREGRRGEAEAALRALVDDAEVKNKARLALGKLLLDDGRLDDARATLGTIDPRSPEADVLGPIERRMAFFADAASYGGEETARAALEKNGKDLDARYALASALAARGQTAEALELFLEIVSRNRKFKDDGARLAMLAIFDQLGGDHELTQDFRRRLQIVL